MRKNKDLEQLVRYGLYTALLAIFTLTPQIGFVTIAPNITITTVPIVAAIIVLKEWNMKGAVYTGLAFGIGSLLAAFMRPTGLAFLFHNPAVSVLPRLLAVLFAFMIVKSIKKTFNINVVVMGVLMGGLVALLNTVFVILAWSTIAKSGLENFVGDNVFSFVAIWIIPSAIVEFIVSAIVVGLLSIKLKHYYKCEEKN